jgi:hypothetical protein
MQRLLNDKTTADGERGEGMGEEPYYKMARKPTPP